MGQAIAFGLLKNKVILFKNLIISDVALEKLELLKSKGVVVTKNNNKAIKGTCFIILAVKPQIMKGVLQDIQHSISQKQVVISIAAGVDLAKITQYLAVHKKVVRVMPNICAKVGQSMSLWFAPKEVSKDEQDEVRVILKAIGKEILLQDEQLLDAFTAISGSGPAYFFYLTEMLEHASQNLGIPEQIAKKVVSQIFIGSAKLLQCDKKSPEVLRKEVTSKGGTTEAAFDVIMESHVEGIFFEAVSAALERAHELQKNI